MNNKKCQQHCMKNHPKGTKALADLHTKFSGTCPSYRTQFFWFCIHFHQKVPMSKVHVPQKWVHAPTENPGSAPAKCDQL